MFWDSYRKGAGSKVIWKKQHMILPSFGQVDAGITTDFPRFLQEVRSWRFRCWSPAAHLFVTGGGPLLSYCWWKKSCTTWDVKNPVNNRNNYLSTVAGFLPATVFLVYLATFGVTVWEDLLRFHFFHNHYHSEHPEDQSDRYIYTDTFTIHIN